MKTKKNGDVAVPKAVWRAKASQYRDTKKALLNILNIPEKDLLRIKLYEFICIQLVYAKYCDGAAYSTRKGRPKIFVERDDTQIEKIMTPVENDISFYKMIEAERGRLAGSEFSPMSITKTIRWYLTEVAEEEFLKKYKLRLPSFITDNFNASANRYQRGKRAIKKIK